MEWNWQRNDWPIFTWDASRLAEAERQFLLGGGVLLGAAQHLGQDQQDDVRVEVMSGEALTTSEIEGEMLDRVSLQSSIRRRLGLLPDNRRAEAREQGIGEMMVDVLQTFAPPLTEESLCSWQAMVANGRRDLTDIGQLPTALPSRCRSSPHGPTSTLSTLKHRPPSEYPRRWIVSWNGSTRRKKRLPALDGAGIAHLYFESIHPFEDGNGRVGRAVAQKALAQGVGRPIILALSPTLLARRREILRCPCADPERNERPQ